MRSFFVLMVFVVWLAGCSSGAAPSSGGPVDASDGSTPDGGACALVGATYDKTCGTAADCLMVAVGCYCGAEPVIGVAKTAQPAAQACESQAEKSCALGCAKTTGHVGEDGQNDEGTGRNLETLCDAGKCYTALAP